jgi:hypothetical protein
VIRLNNNQALYDYLLHLAAECEAHGATRAREILTQAIGCAAGMSTEFLGESKIALQRILREEENALTAAHRADVGDVLQQITAALTRSPQRAEQ